MSPDRLVFGVASEWADSQLEAVYAPLLADGVPLVVTDLAHCGTGQGVRQLVPGDEDLVHQCDG
jgi:hypothetical protein